jgi:hypothetical protein
MIIRISTKEIHLIVRPNERRNPELNQTLISDTDNVRK